MYTMPQKCDNMVFSQVCVCASHVPGINGELSEWCQILKKNIVLSEARLPFWNLQTG